ncbi:MAG: succinylglutamate desuccinylase/aspartoacylase family protein [Haliscomenobacter sp.]|nr:succinylglutamate desuccinylase/aspartoacylase family protein [Haliscomenobacter sp.]
MQGRKNAIRLTAGNVPVVDELRIQDTPPGTIGEYWLNLVHNGIGEPINIPFMVARGKEEGPIVGLTAAIHGNELNGIALIQKLFRDLDPTVLKGSVVGVLVLNVPGLLLEKRQFNDGSDLNRIAPGRPDGNVSQVYIHRLVQKILPGFEYLIDLHTASFGRVNSWYIRADMNAPKTARMARLQNPEILLHNKANDGTFRGAASAMGIEAITLELRDPHVFQQNVIAEALVGIRNVLYDLGMLEGAIQMHEKPTLLCESSYWIYTDEGGILEVFPSVGSFVQKGALIAEVRNIFGQLHRQYVAPEYGVVIGKGIDPISPTGGRILHLGIRPKYL